MRLKGDTRVGDEKDVGADGAGGEARGEEDERAGLVNTGGIIL